MGNTLQWLNSHCHLSETFGNPFVRNVLLYMGYILYWEIMGKWDLCMIMMVLTDFLAFCHFRALKIHVL